MWSRRLRLRRCPGFPCPPTPLRPSAEAGSPPLSKLRPHHPDQGRGGLPVPSFRALWTACRDARQFLETRRPLRAAVSRGGNHLLRRLGGVELGPRRLAAHPPEPHPQPKSAVGGSADKSISSAMSAGQPCTEAPVIKSSLRSSVSRPTCSPLCAGVCPNRRGVARGTGHRAPQGRAAAPGTAARGGLRNDMGMSETDSRCRRITA